MKKLIVLFITLALLVGVGNTFATQQTAAITAYAGYGEGTLRTVTTINNTNQYTLTTIPTTSTAVNPGVEPGKVQIVGWSIEVIGQAYVEGLASMVDAGVSFIGNEDTEIIGEAEATSTVPFYKIFPQGLELRSALTIRQGAGTIVTVYYVKVRP